MATDPAAFMVASLLHPISRIAHSRAYLVHDPCPCPCRCPPDATPLAAECSCCLSPFRTRCWLDLSSLGRAATRNFEVVLYDCEPLISFSPSTPNSILTSRPRPEYDLRAFCVPIRLFLLQTFSLRGAQKNLKIPIKFTSRSPRPPPTSPSPNSFITSAFVPQLLRGHLRTSLYSDLTQLPLSEYTEPYPRHRDD